MSDSEGVFDPNFFDFEGDTLWQDASERILRRASVVDKTGVSEERMVDI